MGNIKVYFKNMLLSYLIAICLLSLTGVIFAYTDISDNLLVIFVMGIVVTTVLIGSTLTSRKMKKRGIITGIIFAVIYFAIIYTISMVFCAGFFMTPAVGIYFTICLVSAMVGGVIGVNL